MRTYNKRSSYDYHTGTVAHSDHSLERHMQRVQHLSAQDQKLVLDRAVQAAAHPKNREHTGVRILTTSDQHVWAVVAGRTVKTILTSPKGVHLNQVSPCNRYAIVG